MLAEINLTALVSIDKVFQEKERVEKIILVDVPTAIYPTLYEIFVYLFKQSGLKEIRIAKEVNFEKLYSEKLKSN